MAAGSPGGVASPSVPAQEDIERAEGLLVIDCLIIDCCRLREAAPNLGRMIDIRARFGARIRELRGERGWSQEHFADLCGLHRTYIGSIERGEQNISLVNIEKLAATLGVSLAGLFAPFAEPPAPPS
jgi:DNA-binding XRE family transcriptional regulator